MTPKIQALGSCKCKTKILMNITTTDPQQTEGAICLIQIKERQGLLIYNLGLAMRTLITETWSQYLPRGLKNLVGEEVPEARSEGATRRGRHPRRPVRAAAAWQRPVPAGALRGGAAGADGVDTPHAGAAGGGDGSVEPAVCFSNLFSPFCKYEYSTCSFKFLKTCQFTPSQ